MAQNYLTNLYYSLQSCANLFIGGVFKNQFLSMLVVKVSATIKYSTRIK